MQARRGYEVIEDRYLVAASLSGSAAAYDELVRRYRGAAILVAWKTLGCREAAQDAAQEAFVIAFQRLAQLKDHGQFGPWLRVIAQNRARAVRTRESRTEPLDQAKLESMLDHGECDACGDPQQALLKKETTATVRCVIGALSEGVQTVVELYYREQWSVEQIAEFLSLTRTTVKWRLHTGREQIARLLEEMQ